MSWWDEALCAQTDPNLFVLEKGESAVEAKKICAQCPVVEPCLQYALDNNIREGIYGGLGPLQRRNLRRAAA